MAIISPIDQMSMSNGNSNVAEPLTLNQPDPKGSADKNLHLSASDKSAILSTSSDKNLLIAAQQVLKQKKYVPQSSLVRIRSGDGELHYVTRSLLEQSSYFSSLLADRWSPSLNQEIEVCCASQSFRNLLNVLRYGQEAAADLTSAQKFMLLTDAVYFGFPSCLFDRIYYTEQVARPSIRLPPRKVRAPRFL
jgi:hypothetical protein